MADATGRGAHRLPVAIVAIVTSLTLWATFILPLTSALGGFGDPVVIFIATLFVVSEGIDRITTDRTTGGTQA